MTVQVEIEDFDINTIVEQEIIDEIRRQVGISMREISKEYGINYVALSEMIKTTVDKTVQQVVSQRIEMIDKKIERALEKEIEGLATVKVAKALAAYEKIKNNGNAR